MTRLLVLVEGQSEEVFVNRTLAPHLAAHGVFVAKPILIWTKRLAGGGGHRGGVSHYQQIRNSLDPLLRNTVAWVTTLIDYYALPADFPGLAASSGLIDPKKKVAAITQAFAEDVAHPRFLPFLALHELEAWLFASPHSVARHFDKAGLTSRMQAMLTAAGEVELINGEPATHPKARICSLVPTYKEVADGAIILGKIGVEPIRASCPHFARWLGQLEALGSPVV
ncbi:MAG: DUF4276 family protein [Rhizobiales bacterium]|jgi:hypothetical protein|nr:DUF4276 family protein [Hyphomicrobiales bacterium]